MAFTSVENLKSDITIILKKQGYVVKPNGFFALKNDGQEVKRKAHKLAKAER